MFVFFTCKCGNNCSVASLQTGANVIVAVSQMVVKTRRVILFLKILDVILKCGTECSGFKSAEVQKLSIKLPAGKYKI